MKIFLDTASLKEIREDWEKAKKEMGAKAP